MSIREFPEDIKLNLRTKTAAQIQRLLELESQLAYKEGYLAGLNAAYKILKKEDEKDSN